MKEYTFKKIVSFVLVVAIIMSFISSDSKRHFKASALESNENISTAENLPVSNLKSEEEIYKELKQK